MEEKNLFALMTFLLFLLLQNVSGQNPQKMDMNQTLSDGAQSHQIAFDGLGFITGNFCACSFVPPGKVADYFGFQYTRDNDVTGMGHNSDFSGILANNLLYVLDNTQKALIVQTAKAQVAIIQQYAYLRFPLIDAFIRMRDKNMPSGCSGLDSTAIKEYSAKLYRVDGRVCLQRAQVYARIINSLTEKQKHYLDSVKVLGGRNMPDVGEQIDKKAFGISDNNVFVGVMSIADDIYSWYTGNLESDVYICPERQGNYFGSFYLKDAPAMLQPNYSIDTNLSQSGGQRFLNTLNTEQKAFITELTEKQKSEMYALVDRRTDISKLLRGYLTGATVDTAKVLDLSEDYGELDGIISYYYATNFSKVNWTLTTAQMDTLMKIRNLDEFPCYGAYLYSDAIAMPAIENTDFLFQASSVNIQLPERIATGFQFTEGPCWMEDAGGYLLFSDIDANKVYKWSPTTGVKEFIANSGKSNGLATDGYGTLYLAQQGNRQIGKQKVDGSIETLCSTFGGKRLNSPNDLVVNKNGSIFFTDPDYGVTPANKELTFNGVYILQNGKTEPKLLINDLPKPNGIALSPDEWNLYVCDSELKKVFAYEMKSESEIRRKYEFATFSGEIDGIKTDLDGNVYVVVSEVGIQVFSPKGELKQTINLPEKTRNLCWGDQYRNTLYITAGNSLYRMKINSDFPFIQTELLSRPTESSVTLSMMTEAETELYVEYGLVSGTYTSKTSTVTATPGTPRTIEISGLDPGKTYYYRVSFRVSGESTFKSRNEFSFQTQRKTGESFTFDIHADPHLDESSNYQTYSNALQNTLTDSPDFMVDLGDNFMSDKLPVQDYQTIEKRAILFRHFYEKAAHSVPLYMVLGNHEAEAGWELDGTSENVAVWNTLIRKKYFPNPEPNQFYTGDSIPENYVGLRGNYYAWNWGDALFVVIDPYWFTDTKPGQNYDGWQWTLGEEQYKYGCEQPWKKVLQNSSLYFVIS
jgi:sugar lactone lactonase YvrE